MNLRLLASAALLLSCSAVNADHKSKVDALVNPLVEDEAIVGCVVGVFDNGRQEVHSFGKLARDRDDKPDGNTVYEIGSITKAFTGTLLADMAERNLVALDASLQEFLPDGVKLQYAEDQPPITLADIASQTSGLPRLPNNLRPKDPKNPYADYSEEQLFDFLRSHKLRRPPGKYEYSNLGMGLVGQLLARKTGSTYEQLVIERICQPLEMHDTLVTLSDQQRQRLAPPYNAELRDDKNWDINTLVGAGGLYSTANDLLKLIAASLSDDNRPVVRAIQESWKHRYGKPGGAGVGLGWHIAHDGQTRWHNGMTGGYSSMMLIYPPKRMGVVMLSNTASDTVDQVAERILQSMLGMKVEPVRTRKAIVLTPETLRQFEGTYAITPFFSITVTLVDDQLMAQATGQDRFAIYPESKTKFYYKIVDAQITFAKDKDGNFTKLTLHQNGLNLPGVKLPEKPSK